MVFMWKKYVEEPTEFQIVASPETVAHLSERDCSIQRRLVSESPFRFMTEKSKMALLL